jgi:hypothetical protein
VEKLNPKVYLWVSTGIKSIIRFKIFLHLEKTDEWIGIDNEFMNKRFYK